MVGNTSCTIQDSSWPLSKTSQDPLLHVRKLAKLMMTGSGKNEFTPSPAQQCCFHREREKSDLAAISLAPDNPELPSSLALRGSSPDQVGSEPWVMHNWGIRAPGLV